MSTASDQAPAALGSVESGADLPRELPQLRRIRLEQGLSQRELADRARCEDSWISKVERGLLRVGPTRAERLAATLGTSAAALSEPAGSGSFGWVAFEAHKSRHRLLDAGELGARVGVHRITVCKLARLGELRGSRYGGATHRPWLFPHSEVEHLQAVLDERQRHKRERLALPRSRKAFNERKRSRQCADCGTWIELTSARAREMADKPVFCRSCGPRQWWAKDLAPDALIEALPGTGRSRHKGRRAARDVGRVGGQQRGWTAEQATRMLERHKAGTSIRALVRLESLSKHQVEDALAFAKEAKAKVSP